MAMDESHRNKCAHYPCRCTVDPGDHFCSEYCARVSQSRISGTLPGQESGEPRCHCGHPPCR